jgi:hypothetical protein
VAALEKNCEGLLPRLDQLGHGVSPFRFGVDFPIDPMLRSGIAPRVIARRHFPAAIAWYLCARPASERMCA